jgi:pimeloyl-ACP methyl ester carboxylesterase
VTTALPVDCFTTPDGSEVRVHDLGGDGEPLLLAHATGFHGLVLAELASHLPWLHSYALDFRAHGCSRAGAAWCGAWDGFASDVLTVTAGLGLEHPYAFGHSLGGGALLLAEEAAPGTFRHLFLYEPVVVPTLDPPPASFDNLLSVGAARRREHFDSKRQALENYASKPPLCILHPVVLAAYVEHGFETDPDGGVRLRCSPADEARVFANAGSHDGFRNLSKLRCPVVFACGARTDSLDEGVMRELNASVTSSGGTARTTVFAELGHFGPMERPEIVAAAMAKLLGT